MEGLGYKIGDVCYSTTSHTFDGKSIVPGSRGTVTGPSTSSLADADQRVHVKFDSGLVANQIAKKQLKTAAGWAAALAQVRTARLQPHTQRPE